MNFLDQESSALAAQQLAIDAELKEKLEPVLKAVYPGGKVVNGEFEVGDVKGKPGKSLKICLKGVKRGIWCDFESGEKGATPLQLLAMRFDLTHSADLKILLKRVRGILENLPLSESQAPKLSVLADAIKEVGCWDYRDADGNYLWSIVRFESNDGKKTIRPYNKVLKTYKAHPEPRPLYNLPGILKSDNVIIVEGEKCAQALIDAGYCATTAMGGANAPASMTDWSMLSDKIVVVWRDNDEPGKIYAGSCAQAAMAAGATSCVVLEIPDGMPNGWDAADAVGAGSNFDLSSFLACAKGQQIQLASDHALVDAFENADWRTEHGIANVFSELFGPDRKYCAAWGHWYSWNIHRWVQDQVLESIHLARQTAHAASTFAKTPGIRAKLASAATTSNVERLARADPRHAIAVELWDADPLLLNTVGGIVDLRTGKVLAFDRTKYMTKSASATPKGECPKWLEFLRTITAENQELVDYLQRVIGYCLTGLIVEHALFFFYGTGANGKSVFLNVLSTILGDYAKTAPMDTFMDTRSDRHPTDLAGLRGARLVCAVETEQGRRWNESKIKTLTGGDPISARYMRQDFFEFTPQFKLLIAGNHKPSISNVDEAMSRRIHLIPFTVFIPPEKRDKQLTEKMLQERDGILAWAVQGLLSWHKLGGLNPPAVVTQATKDYLEAEDYVQSWIDDCCEPSATSFVSSKDLFESWSKWAEAHGEYIGSARKLSEQLINRKFESCRQNKVRGFKGLLIKDIGLPWIHMSSGPVPASSDLASKL